MRSVNLLKTQWKHSMNKGHISCNDIETLKTFWPISTFSKENFVTFYHFRFLQVKKWRLLFSHPSIQTSMACNSSNHPSIHLNGGAWLTYFTDDEFPQHQLCNNMILPWKAEIMSVLIAGLSLGCKW